MHSKRDISRVLQIDNLENDLFGMVHASQMVYFVKPHNLAMQVKIGCLKI